MPHPSMPTRLGACASRLVPVLQAPGGAGALSLIPDHIEIALAVEGADGRTRTLGPLDYRAWSASPQSLFPMALDNLRQRCGAAWAEPGEGPAVRMCASDHVASSRALLLPELMTPWPAEGVLVTVPCRDRLLCLPLRGVGDLRALDFMLQATRQLFQSTDEPISDQLFWFDCDNWSAIAVNHESNDGPILQPTPSLRRAVARLVCMSYVSGPASA